MSQDEATKAGAAQGAAEATGEVLEKREAIAYELEQIWGRSVTACAISRFIDASRDPLPAKRIRRRVVIRRGELEAWARRQVA